jgi:hypothetical protein
MGSQDDRDPSAELDIRDSLPYTERARWLGDLVRNDEEVP